MTESTTEGVGGSARNAALAVLALAAALCVIRMTAPADLLDKDQERPASYALDVIRNGHWICQFDWKGAVASKPPLLTWLIALASLPGHRVTLLTLYLPSAVAMTGLALLICRVGSRHFGPRAGLFGGLLFLLAPLSVRLLILVRTDALFSFTVALAAFAAFYAGERGKGWTWFWLAAALATLTKGPLGVAFAISGLFAVLWERRGPEPMPLRGNQAFGIALFLIMTVGWFVMAYRVVGDGLIDKMIRSEIIEQSLQNPHADPFYQRLIFPILYFIHRNLPASLLALVAFVRLIRWPAADPRERRMERFLFCWFWIGLLILSLGQHQRADLVAPIIAPAALLAGRELDRWMRCFVPRYVAMASVACVAAALAHFAVYYHLVVPREEPVIRTAQVREFADELRGTVGGDFPFIHVDDPFLLQFYLNTMRERVRCREARVLLAGNAPAFAVVRAKGDDMTCILDNTSNVYEVARCPRTGEPYIRILGNRPTMER